MTECIEVGVKKGDNGQPYWTYRMAEGDALLIDDDRRETTDVKISAQMAKQAKDVNLLRFVGGKTVAVFEIDGKQYAQRLPIKEGSRVGKIKQAAKVGRPAPQQRSRAGVVSEVPAPAVPTRDAAVAPVAPRPAAAGPVKQREAPRRKSYDLL